jgi:hypothetical protein
LLQVVELLAVGSAKCLVLFVNVHAHRGRGVCIELRADADAAYGEIRLLLTIRR